jgi:hypothetical protein
VAGFTFDEERGLLSHSARPGVGPNPLLNLINMKKVGLGIIGGGLMGREMASAFARWCALMDVE